MRESEIERFKAVLDYDPDTGVFTWKARTGRGCRRDLTGKTAGGPQNDGYIHISLYGKKYLAHRLAWLFTHGQWPEGEIDHINRIRDDNRLANLRDVTKSINQRNRNNVRGADFHLASGKWRSRINVSGKSMFLGYFNDLAEAEAAYLRAKSEHHPEAPR